MSIDNISDDQGVVYKKTTGYYQVHTRKHDVIVCTISSRLRKELMYSNAVPVSPGHRVREVKAIEHFDPVAVGDRVRFIDARDGTGMIVEVLPRRSQLSRRSAVPMPGAYAFEQVVVSNLDQVVPVFAVAEPSPKWNLLDRYLVLAESLELDSVICITKLDIASAIEGVSSVELGKIVAEYRRIGYPVILTSITNGEGLDAIRQVLKGRVSVLLGKSGVGKSSLLNALLPCLQLRVNVISEATGKGKHTTTNPEMFPLEGGGAVVDTPGVREFGFWNLDKDNLALFFPEMRPYIGHCRFGLDCAHNDEPGCAIRKAVMDGQISARRYRSYMMLKNED
jgi:ribosome biogenesis GTPase / thiamine phosphate phosphatase